MQIIRSKRKIGWLNNRRMLNPPKLYSQKGLTQPEKESKLQLEFSFIGIFEKLQTEKKSKSMDPFITRIRATGFEPVT